MTLLPDITSTMKPYPLRPLHIGIKQLHLGQHLLVHIFISMIAHFFRIINNINYIIWIVKYNNKSSSGMPTVAPSPRTPKQYHHSPYLPIASAKKKLGMQCILYQTRFLSFIPSLQIVRFVCVPQHPNHQRNFRRMELKSVISNEMIDLRLLFFLSLGNFFVFIFCHCAIFLIDSLEREDIVTLFGLNLRSILTDVGFFLGFLLAKEASLTF